MPAKNNQLTNVLLKNPIYIVLLALIVYSLIAVPGFSNPANLLNLIYQTPDLIIVACGLMFVILNGGIDFSITSIIGLTSVVGASFMNLDDGHLKDNPFSVLISVACMLAIGLGIGALNGICVTRLKMPSFIATMSVSMIFGGLAVYYSPRTLANLPLQFTNISHGNLFLIPNPTLIVIVVIVIATFVLLKTKFGTYVYAIGTNPKASYISGLPVKNTIFKLFVISGFLAGLSGVIVTARIGAGKPTLGSETLLDIVTAVIAGGTSIFGGSGTILGVVAGAFFINVLNNSLTLSNVMWFNINIVKGLILIAIAILDAARRSKA
jgi:ribose/xylose/arabinose/galactoside ABC-type transport system permease subunit